MNIGLMLEANFITKSKASIYTDEVIVIKLSLALIKLKLRTLR